MKECSNCGNQNREDAKFCSVCGNIFTSDDKDSGDESSNFIETLEEGTLLKGRYDILELLSIGGMGYVYRGIDTQDGSVVAIKEMIDRFTDSKERDLAIDRFQRESDMLCQMRHAAIPKFLDHFTENNRHYIIMEFVEGQDLYKIIDETYKSGKKIPIDQIVRWTIEICDVLEYLHDHKPPIIYRDLKPSNIVVNSQKEVRLVDFGIARIFIPTIKATMIGTHGYAPPEQYRGEAEPRSDIYSLGATLHHLLSGRDPQDQPPFQFEALSKIDDQLPEDLCLIVKKALELSPEDRFQSAKKMKVAVTNFAIGESIFTEELSDEIRSIQDEIYALKKQKSDILNPEEVMKEKIQQDRRAEMRKNLIKEQAKTWRFFRGNECRTGFIPLPGHHKGRLKWRYKTDGVVITSPVVDGDENIYFGSQDQKFYSLDSQGKLRWTAPLQDTNSAGIDLDGNIYVPSEMGTVDAFDNEGHHLWRFYAKSPVLTSVLVYNDNIFVGCQDGRIYCINTSGNQVWRFNCGGSIIASIAACDDTLYVGTESGLFVALNLEGQIIWNLEFKKGITSTPVVSSNGTIYVGCQDYNLYALNFKGEFVWQFKTSGKLESSPALGKDGTVYLGSTDHCLYAIDEKGKEKWRFDAGDPIVCSPAVTDEGSIYFASNSGFLYNLQPYGKSKWWFNLNGTVYSSCAIGPKGILYIGSGDGCLYAIS